jgi:penicillin-binding protein 2
MKLGEHRDDLAARVRVLGGAVSVALAAIALGFWFVQGVRGAYYREMAENNRLREVPVRAPRGLIYDRGEHLLVENIPSYDLYVDRARTRDLGAALDFASTALGRPRADLGAVLGRYRATPSFAPVLLAEDLTIGQVARFGVAALDFPGFEVEVGHQRLYRQAEQLAHVLGYLGEVATSELESGRYRSGELVGKNGVEQTYDERLRGEDGRRVLVVDSQGRPTREEEKQPSRPGETLRLTIDLALQQAAQRALADNVGVAVALDPRNGEILALVSTPAYDPNLFARRLSADQWQTYLADTRHPMQNRAIQNTYSPGSLFKVVVALGLLSEHAASAQDRVVCRGVSMHYGRPFRCWKPGGHGSVDLHAALRESCDTYFYHFGSQLGIDTIAKYARLLGFGRATGIDLGGEKSGLVPDSQWSLAARKHRWYPGETVSVAIGQGPLLSSPLQVAVAMAAIANGGFRVTPHLVRQDSPLPLPALPVDSEALARVRHGLWAVVNEAGTGAGVRIEGLDIAGKTATVQVVAQKTRTENASLPYEQRDHAWFASFAPAAAPEIVIVVFVEHGGGGSRAAAPVAKRIYETYYHDRLVRQRAL